MCRSATSKLRPCFAVLGHMFAVGALAEAKGATGFGVFWSLPACGAGCNHCLRDRSCDHALRLAGIDPWRGELPVFSVHRWRAATGIFHCDF
jgi:hypothetical protein